MPGRRQIVARELTEKLRLEKAFGREVRSIFARMVKDFRVTVARNGFAPNSISFLEDWQSVLKRHYERTQEAFAGEVLDQQKKCNRAWYERKQQEAEEEDDFEKGALFALALQSWRESHKDQSANLISKTNQRDFQAALSQARDIIREQDLPTDNRTLAATAAAILARKFNGRVGNILMFETQQAAESTKLIEASVLSETQPFPPGGFGVGDTQAIKSWFTVGDDLVRDIHEAADGQKKKSTNLLLLAGNYLCTQAIQLWGHLRVMFSVVGALLNMNYREI